MSKKQKKRKNESTLIIDTSLNNCNYNKCTSFEKNSDGYEWCHNDGLKDWTDFLNYIRDERKYLRCKGNFEECKKLKQQFLLKNKTS